MKKTKYLYPVGVEPDGMISASQIQSYMSCPRKWKYSYIDKLSPRVERSYLTIGKLCHKGMESMMRARWEDNNASVEQLVGVGVNAIKDMWEEYMCNTPMLPEETADQNELMDNAVNVFSQAAYEFNPTRYSVYTIYDNGEPAPALEMHFKVPCTSSKGLHGFVDSILVDNETGEIWCVDYKFRKTLAPDDDEQFNIQNCIYSYVCNKMGIDVTGTMTWQHINTAASTPSVNKDGSVSRSKIKTTWDAYSKFVESLGQNPDDYADMKEKLSDVEFFRATKEYRNDYTVKSVWDCVVVPVSKEINKCSKIGDSRSTSMFPMNCKMCQFAELCQAELRGYDVDYIVSANFVRKNGR